VKLHPYLVPRLRMGGAVSLMACAQEQFRFTFIVPCKQATLFELLTAPVNKLQVNAYINNEVLSRIVHNAERVEQGSYATVRTVQWMKCNGKRLEYLVYSSTCCCTVRGTLLDCKY
jgi:hypothetical protein